MTSKQSREIKFRIPMECQNGHKSYWFYVLNRTGGTKSIKTASEYNPKCNCPKHNLGDGWEEVGKEELYTGLKDKNSKEIYEGDIVRCKCRGRGGEPIGEIRWYEDYGCWGIHRPGDYDCEQGKPLGSRGSSTPYRNYSFKSFTSFEIIGNIHENPKLLTKPHD